MPISEQDKSDIIANALDPKKVYFYCKEHGYYGPSKINPEAKPYKGCANCWKVYYICDMIATPPSEREQRLAELEEVLHDVVQMVEQGTWDFKPFRHAQIEIGPE